ncbi:MAG: SciE type virulence protein [Planctomycetes bacterium]|nr:SciE type virulence protein [Planctomycetota bacterium]
MTPGELFKQGKLVEAVNAALQEVRTNPTDRGKRLLLSELLCFTGDLERADKQLDMLAQPDAPDLVAIARFRQLLRAETARREFYEQGRLPDFLEQPTPVLMLCLEASIRIREGKPSEAAELLREAEVARVKPRGTLDGTPFEDFRDLDDLSSPYLEILTANGTYYWIPIETIESAEFPAPVRPRDLLWRRVHLQVRGGPEGEVYTPALYPGSHKEADESIRLGRGSEYRDAGGFTRGAGLREFLAGENVHSALSLKNFEIPSI